MNTMKLRLSREKVNALDKIVRKLTLLGCGNELSVALLLVFCLTFPTKGGELIFKPGNVAYS